MSSYPMETLTFQNPHNGKHKRKPENSIERQKQAEKNSEKEEEETWGSVLNKFCQETTIQGLKQIAEPTPFTIRRVIWVLLLMVGIALFIYQLVASVIYYLSWPVAVNVKINYNDTIRFPAITICNQNAFRSTVAAEQGMYHLLTDLYTHQGEHGFREKYGSIVANLSLEEILLSAGHNKSDMIVSCEWDNKPCSPEDFETTLTDHGMCFTFNSGLNMESIEATETGANHGLRLRVNIEQYEYMSGPNEGAGVKILLHDQFDQPLVRDLGQAIPPGSHAFVGVRIVQVHNLKPPHGVCNDSVKLDFYTSYTMASCLIDHQERALRDNCGCRMYYMPPDEHGQLPVCTLQQYLDCVIPTLGALSSEKRVKNRCPVLCIENHYDPSITYASNSNFDVEKMLHGDTTELRRKFAKAREVSQRVSHTIVKTDHHNIDTLVKTMKEVEEAWSRILQNLDKSLDTVDAWMADIKKRIHFHVDRGLNGVKFIIEHDFIRGYEVMAERTLPFVSHAYLELISSYKRIMHQINDTVPLGEQDTRRVLWTIVDNLLQNKLEVSTRARDNITEVDNAYRNAIPILTWTYSLDRRYDMSYITPELLFHNPKRQDEYFTKLMANIQLSVKYLNKLIKQGYQFVDNGTVDEPALKKALDRFASSCRGYNYRLFQYRDRIVLKSRELIQDRIDAFLKLNESLFQSYDELKSFRHSVIQLIETVNTSDWNSVRDAGQKCQEYLTDTKYKKSDLARSLNSETIDTNLQHIRIFFASLRSRAQDISDVWVKIAGAYKNIYMNMLTETSTKKFYAMVHDDVEAYTNNVSTKEFYIPQFAYMLRMKGAARRALYDLDPKELIPLMNADFNRTVPTRKIIELTHAFLTLPMQTDIITFVGEKDDQFFKAFGAIQSSLSEFSRGNKIDYDFYRQNFMKVDVFMRELSYEEITQQVAYDMTNLWSDIGGSIGLFIGASVLSFFEILDMFIFTSLKFGAQKRQAKKEADKHKYEAVPISNASL